jgi:hypothetical protein
MTGMEGFNRPLLLRLGFCSNSKMHACRFRCIWCIGPWEAYRYIFDYFLLSLPEYRGLVPAIASIAVGALLVIFVERPIER